MALNKLLNPKPDEYLWTSLLASYTPLPSF